MLNNHTWLSKKTLLILFFAITVLGGFSVFRSYADTPNTSKAHVDFSEFHPNTDLNTTHYISNNYVQGQPEWAVLWFSGLDAGGKYQMYNSNPAVSEGACHWDDFQWSDTGLAYNSTVRDSQLKCGGKIQSNKITYSPGIVYLPRLWNGTNWVKEGRSVAVFEEAGAVKCRGVIEWRSEVFEEPVELSPGVTTTHMRSSQKTSWTHGEGSSTGCKPGVTSRYEENLYFVTDLQVQGGQQIAKGLKRSVGGNLDRYEKTGVWDWDIWFHQWQPLPPNIRGIYSNHPLRAAKVDTFTRMADGLAGKTELTVGRVNDTVLFAGKRPYTAMKIGKNSQSVGDALIFKDAAEIKAFVDKEVMLGAKKFKLCISARATTGTALATIGLFGELSSFSVPASNTYNNYCSPAVNSPEVFTTNWAPYVTNSSADLIVDSLTLAQGS